MERGLTLSHERDAKGGVANVPLLSGVLFILNFSAD